MKIKNSHLFSSLVMVVASLSVVCPVGAVDDGLYLIGLGSNDMTGPAADVNMIGYSNLDQVAAGIHFRLRARTFVVAESQEGARFAFVNLDAGMASQLVTIKVLERLRSRYGSVYNESNIAISATHTHAGSGGYSQYLLYSVTSYSFAEQSFDAIVEAVVESVAQAHGNLRPGFIFINKGDVENANINRSPSAYLQNPAEERAQYPDNVDNEMTLLKFVDKESGKSIGSFNWYATHGTSMSKDNKLISGDNKGVAARLFEDRIQPKQRYSFNFTEVKDKSTLLDFAIKFKATGGQRCNQTTSKNFKVRKTDGSQFVAGFCQSNMGDVSPNVMGEICLESGKACDVKHSSCQGNNQLCVSRGPGYPNEVLSTGIIGFRQFDKAINLFDSAKEKLHGKINYRHVHLDLTSVEIALPGNKFVKTCPAAVGPGFAAGTTDGPGAYGFQQGDTVITDFWTRMRYMLNEPGDQQVNCHLPKMILLDVGEMFDPYPWVPAILPIQILRIGKLIILSVPAEFTTMAGRRLREAVKESLIQNRNGEFDDDFHVVIAGPTNAYSQYVTTIEEYQQQRHEGASTLYGPHTLSAYIQEFKKLATAMATGEYPQANNLSPPDLSGHLFNPRQGTLADAIPPGKNFGDIKEDVHLPPDKKFLHKGDKVRATFWSGNPTNDLLTEGTFAVVERWLAPDWYPVYDDDDLCLCFEWRVDDKGNGLATVEWEIQEADAGIYRLRHFGAAKQLGHVEYFTGASRAFLVLKMLCHGSDNRCD